MTKGRVVTKLSISRKLWAVTGILMAFGDIDYIRGTRRLQRL